MIDRTQYIETLIKLIELNEDQYWSSTFRNLRNGGHLPGGGAGSLNDWGPTYIDKFQHVWYSDFYRIMRFLFDNNLTPDSINEIKTVVNNYKISIIRCTVCNERYQHPSRFESHIAIDFYRKNISNFYNNKRLIEILKPVESYENPSAKSYRDWIKNEYDRIGIKIYDFVKSKYICPHCGRQDSETEHDLYKIEKTLIGTMRLNHIKDNADWNDFK